MHFKKIYKTNFDKNAIKIKMQNTIRELIATICKLMSRKLT